MNLSAKEDASSKKREAFKSFLETSSSPTKEGKKNASDQQEVYQQQYVQELSNCNICGIQVQDAVSKKKCCAFCSLAACADHLRKRRKKKNKWEKICDSCEDKLLYDTYMKLQIKAQESLAVEQQIVAMKYQDLKQVLQNKRVRSRQLIFNTQQIQSKYDQKITNLTKQDNKFLSLNNRLESDQLTCHQIVEYINRMENKIKSNYQQDYRILSEQDSKLGAELSRIEKKCWEVRSAIQKRQRQLQQAYQNWERKQFNRQQEQAVASQKNNKKGKQDGCFIF